MRSKRYSDALSNEIRPFGVDVIVIEPGAIESEWGGIAADEAERYFGLTRFVITHHALCHFVLRAVVRGPHTDKLVHDERFGGV
jgi:short-subunit dehydrogenase